ncbi:hypothetical protein [Pseudorhodoplanes sp.]|uniref:hypothetical protein n=1 Tax=Pseudorhodoplanes sp. TaxID=1934341 RepID=UPI002C128AA2|nr:hypothetical protein [Pseudorhodoplanes sp.]HWV51473.1 hypothetical protein [Pseudorhodoplanes sp.]
MKSGAALIAMFILAWSGIAFAQERSSPMPKHLPLGQEVCFGRVYDAAHLKKHPKQRVTAFHLFRDFTPDPNKETPQDTRETLVAEDGDGGIRVTAYVRFRDRPGLFFNGLHCGMSVDGDKVSCGIDCDGGGFFLKDAGKSLLLENRGFVVVGGCGASEDEEENRDFVKPGADDKIFRLDPLPAAQCRALEDSRKPAWVALGAPLRERLGRDDAVCFSRSYDAAHLKAHPQQTVRRISVLKAKGEKPEDGEFPAYKLVFRVELKNGKVLKQTTTCAPDQYAYACTHNIDADTARDFYLTRAGKDHVMLRDRRGAMNKLFGATLGSDDRAFKLQESPAEACTF